MVVTYFETNSVQPDYLLVSQVLAGHRDVYAHLVRRYERHVHAAAWAILGDHQAAEDVTQETFVKAYDKLNTLRTPRRFGPWLMTIVRRTATDLARTRNRLVVVPNIRDMPDERDMPNEEDAAHVLSALAGIPDQEQQVILFRYFDELAVADIATLLGCSVGTVTKRLSRAVTRLRDRLKEL
ncbi:ECF RNA polymerase sigma factor SigW [Gimesia chilikensis]|uniref:RNA polymerase sigma factor n=1 Tax=Gimesia chilikensis TaxID=2605989 RepID=A0A517W8Y3_9PLAN|nr:RNA polymerase sigma factor [Gimesia chilikensis]QDU01698.1 ECF RNA polymerase sigma factor SigW [Gimesia chilikensis]